MQMRQTAQNAPDGTVLAACEQVALDEGRAFLRSSLPGAVQSRVEAAEQKGGRAARAAAHASTPPATKEDASVRH